MKLYELRQKLSLLDEVPITKKEKRNTTISFTVTLTICSSILASIPVYNVIQNQKYKGVNLDLFDRNFMGVPYTVMLPNDPITVAISKSFSTLEQEQIKNAVNTLDTVAEGLTFTCEITDDFSNKKVSVKQNDTDQMLQDDFRTLAYTTSTRYAYFAKIMFPITISVNPSYVDSYISLEDIAEHELGHVIGLTDVDDIQYINKTHMFYLANYSSMDFTLWDASSINTVYPKKQTEHQDVTGLSALKVEKKEEEQEETYYTIG